MKKLFVIVFILYAFNISAAPKIDYSKAYYNRAVWDFWQF